MKNLPKYPSLYQINTRVWLTTLSHKLGRQATFDDIPDTELNHFAALGFDWIWLLSVWQTSEQSREVSRENPGFRMSFEKTLPDLKEEDIEGSGFAIAAYKVITYLSPGLRFFHPGQFEGRTKHISPHLIRASEEHVDEGIRQFYDEFLPVLSTPVFRDGHWRMIECMPAWVGNETPNDFLAFYWELPEETRALVVVNFADHGSQCHIHLPLPNHEKNTIQFGDLMSPALYDRDGSELSMKGLYVDMPEWGYHIFEISYL